MHDPANLEALVYKGTTLTGCPLCEALEIFNRILKVAPDLLEAMSMGKGFALDGGWEGWMRPCTSRALRPG